jgi:hypothetical protein
MRDWSTSPAMRPHRRHPDSGPPVRHVFPTETGGRGVYPTPADGVKRSDDLERGVRCYQCGYPIFDARKAQTCPLCRSDNYEGQILDP